MAVIARFSQNAIVDIDEIKRGLRKPGKSQSGLARALGLDPAAVTRLLKGSRQLKAAEISKVQDYLNGGSNRESAEIGNPNAAIARTGTPPDIFIRDMPQNVPIMGGAACGDDGLFEFNQGDPLGYARRPPRLLGFRDAYAVYVCGDSMSPWREPGDLVYVNPHQPPKIGDYVLVQLKPTDPGSENRAAYIKRLTLRNSAQIRLLQFNPRKEFTVKGELIHSVHRILDWQELMIF